MKRDSLSIAFIVAAMALIVGLFGSQAISEASMPGKGSFATASDSEYRYVYINPDYSAVDEERLLFEWFMNEIKVVHMFEKKSSSSAFSQSNEGKEDEYVESAIWCNFAVTAWNETEETIALLSTFEMLDAGFVIALDIELNPPMPGSYSNSGLQYIPRPNYQDLSEPTYIAPKEGSSATTPSWTGRVKIRHNSYAELQENAEILARKLCNIENIKSINRSGQMSSAIAESEISGKFRLSDYSSFWLSQPIDPLVLYVNQEVEYE